jgi:hydroxyacylglutathione hydrolase
MLKIIPLSAYSDNYIWVLHKQNTNYCAFVDPGDAEVCIKYLQQSKAKLCAILITHAHKDHTDGVKELIHYCQLNRWPINVYYPKNEPIEGGDIEVSEPNHITIEPLEVTFDILDIPGHTLGHVAYVNEQMLFCGDTLFSGGCGRIFSGTAQQLKTSLDKLSALPSELEVYPAHEYTQENLRFAITIEPQNVDLLKYSEYVNNLRSNKKITLPTTLIKERLINPFLRCEHQEIKTSLERHFNTKFDSAMSIFTALRKYKDFF